jgi:hypothetical protein
VAARTSAAEHHPKVIDSICRPSSRTGILLDGRDRAAQTASNSPETLVIGSY